MKQALQGLFVCGDEILLLEVVEVGRRLVVLPLIHDLIGMLRVISSDPPIDELTLRDIVVGGLVGSQLGFNQETIACSIPGHVTLLVFVGH